MRSSGWNIPFIRYGKYMAYGKAIGSAITIISLPKGEMIPNNSSIAVININE
jgi:hypothetical protein